MLSTWDPPMVYMGSPYVFYIYMIKCGWLGNYNINKNNMAAFYELQKKYNEIQLTKNKMNLNNRKMKNKSVRFK